MVCGLLYALPLQAQVVIITHKSVSSPTQEISALADIFTLNTKNWSDGTKITVVDYKNDTPSRARFYATLGMSAGEMQKVWLRKQFSGKATPPILLSSEDEVLARVAATPGAVAYISADKVNSTVKVLATIK